MTAVFASGPPVPQTSRGDVEPAREYTAHIEVHVTAEETLNPMMKPLVNMPCPTSAPGDSIWNKTVLQPRDIISSFQEYVLCKQSWKSCLDKTGHKMCKNAMENGLPASRRNDRGRWRGEEEKESAAGQERRGELTK